MRRLVLLALVAACGSSPKPVPASAAPAAIPEYCESYRGCAEEEARMDNDAASDEEIRAAIEEKVSNCASTYASLEDFQVEWLQSCTGCGGSCDVYRCIEEAPGITREQTPFECDMGYE